MPKQQIFYNEAIIHHFKRKILKMARVEQYHSVDETMVPYFGRLSCKEFIRSKPIKWRYKQLALYPEE